MKTFIGNASLSEGTKRPKKYRCNQEQESPQRCIKQGKTGIYNSLTHDVMRLDKKKAGLPEKVPNINNSKTVTYRFKKKTKG